MNTLQTIYNKLQDKTELAKHEVELGLAQDITAAVNATLEFKEKRKAAWNKASTPLIGLYDILRTEYQAALTAQKGIADLKQKTATLGLEVPAKMLENEKTISAVLKASQAKVSALDKIINQIPNLVL